MKVYFFCTFLGYNLYFSSQFFVLFWGDEPVATLDCYSHCILSQMGIRVCNIMSKIIGKYLYFLLE